MTDILENTIKITAEGEEFVFRVPSPKDYARIGIVAGAMRRNYDPQFIGSEYSVDQFTSELIRAMAIMVVCLEKSTAKWAFTPEKGKDGKESLVVDPDSFPPQATKILVQLPTLFDQEVGRFLGEGV